ncbi:MAG TPA: arginine--tRNA ligase [Candidatus Paceibacterota bacterium]|nr:arginine--tRNA ligase [Candidatus Paceibacterota bacterium]
MTASIKEILKNEIRSASGHEADVLPTPDAALGDYSTNVAFILAKEQKKKPVDAAAELKTALEPRLAAVASIQAAPNGFLNFFLKPEFLRQRLNEIAADEGYGMDTVGAGKTVIVEYSSPNIAKPMHIGHLRSTIIGDALANIYEAIGYRVIRWNYVGDWGTQFGKVIAGYKKWGEGKSDIAMSDMLEWYIRAGKELPDEEGQKEFKKLEDGDPENRKLWEKFNAISLQGLKETYRMLGTNAFDVYKGEAHYEPQLKMIIQKLEKEGKAKESEGALIFDLEKYNLPPGLLRKSDGATLYLTRDLASLEDRLQNYAPAEILYVVANQQALHFEQLFAIARELNLNGAELVHVKFGMVLGEDGKKLATREGKVVPLQDVMDKIVALAEEIVKKKNPDLPEADRARVARAVGIGALKYNDLKQHPYSDIVFDWDAMLDLSGNSGAYLQYTYARLANIIAKAGAAETGNTELLSENIELKLMKQLLEFPDAVGRSAQVHALNGLALYLYELAAAASNFYETVRVLDDENASRKNARLTLIRTVARTLQTGLKLLGIETLGRI